MEFELGTGKKITFVNDDGELAELILGVEDGPFSGKVKVDWNYTTLTLRVEVPDHAINSVEDL